MKPLRDTALVSSKKSARFLFAAILLSILFFAFTPGHYMPSVFTGQDKLNHIVAFFLLTLLGKYAFSTIKSYTLFVYLTLLAIGIEIVQKLFTSREFSMVDAAVGIISILLGLLVHAIIRILKGF